MITQKKLQKMKELFEKLESELDVLNSEQIDWLLKQHNEWASINHCVRWGLQACEDLLEDF